MKTDKSKKPTAKVAAGLTVAGVVATTLGAGIYSANAETRTLVVTLSGGRQVTVNVDAAPGTPVSQIPLPDLGAPVVRVSDVTPAAKPTAPKPSTTTATQTSKTKTESEPAPSSKPSNNGEGSTATTNSGQQQTSTRKTDGSKVTTTETAAANTSTRRSSADASQAQAASGNLFDQSGTAKVPNSYINKFRIPPFLLPIYQAAAAEYGVRWEILAAINEIETDYGRNVARSSAGAEGWMQFMPATWEAYGVDANGDGQRDPSNPVDAIFAAARYLKAAGYAEDVRKAIFAYNHANWYVDQVLMRAGVIAGVPTDMINSLTGLTQGLFPVRGNVRYEGDDQAKNKSQSKSATSGAADSRNTLIQAEPNAEVVAIQDAKVVDLGSNERLGKFVKLRDVYGNTYTYANLGKVAKRYAAPGGTSDPQPAKIEKVVERYALEIAQDPVPTEAATDGSAPVAITTEAAKPSVTASRQRALATDSSSGAPAKERLFANPTFPGAKQNGGAEQVAGTDGGYSSYLADLHGLRSDQFEMKELRKGSKVVAGTRIGSVESNGKESGITFLIRPADKSAPLINPTPILNGWKLLESTAIFRAEGNNPLVDTASSGQILLMSKDQLQRRVLSDPNLNIYDGGRQDIEAGIIDRRTLATMSYLSANGLKLTITSLRSGHSYLTASGNVSAHSSGNAMDIAQVNGITINPSTQGQGSITESTIKLLLQLEGAMKPSQIISLMTFDGADNTFAMGDHDDHIHVGFRPEVSNDPATIKQVRRVLKPGQWIKLIDRVAEIDNPTVLSRPSKNSIKARERDQIHSD